MSRPQLAALALAATTLAVSGCGSSKTASTGVSTSTAPTSTTAAGTTAAATATVKITPGKHLTRAEVIADAGAICKRIKARHALEKLATQQDFVREIPRFASYQQAALAELSKLTPPASMAHEWGQFVAAAHTLAGDTTRLGEYAKARHFAAMGPILTRIDADEVSMKTFSKRDAIISCKLIY